MTTTKTTIERADEIVGISVIFAPQGALDHTGDAVKNTYRRGAYVEWLGNLKSDVNPKGFDLPRGIEDMARCVVELHAASKPKGDGLPDETLVYCPNVAGREGVTIVKQRDGITEGMTLAEQTALARYVQRCLTTATRRFLAAFECVEQRPCGKRCFAVVDGTGGRHIIEINDVGGVWFTEPIASLVCWIVPREAK